VPVAASVRTWLVLVVVAGSACPVRADDTLSLRMRDRSDVDADEPPVHHVVPLSAEAEGGLIDGKAATLDLWRFRVSGEGTWWKSGLAPSAFAEDLPVHGWRAAGELSLDLGFARVGVNASEEHVERQRHRTRGVFARKTFSLSRWMKAWIQVGISNEQWDYPGQPTERSTFYGLSLGTTFR
jgi:hypothetical protein